MDIQKSISIDAYSISDSTSVVETSGEVGCVKPLLLLITTYTISTFIFIYLYAISLQIFLSASFFFCGMNTVDPLVCIKDYPTDKMSTYGHTYIENLGIVLMWSVLLEWISQGVHCWRARSNAYVFKMKETLRSWEELLQTLMPLQIGTWWYIRIGGYFKLSYYPSIYVGVYIFSWGAFARLV